MNYGVFKSFTEEDEEKDVIDILENIEKRQEVKEVKIKSGNKKTVIYIVTSDKRFETQTLLNQQLSDAGFNVSKLFVGVYQIVKRPLSFFYHLVLREESDLNHQGDFKILPLWHQSLSYFQRLPLLIK